MNCTAILQILTGFLLMNFTIHAQKTTKEVQIIGQMKNVMWKGQLYGTIYLDTIANKTHLYGLGPVEYLAGEILVVDGKSYKSTVVFETSMVVEETFDLKAPFFGYANISSWTEQPLPENIQTIEQLEIYLENLTKNATRPFFFKLLGTVEQATIHIVNLPQGSTVSSPEEAHRGQVNYTINNEPSEIIGFFSTEHQTIFTHHDTFMHMHLLTADKQKMGHLDKAVFKKGSMTLYLPKE